MGTPRRKSRTGSSDLEAWCSLLESNQRPPPYQGGALPTELSERKSFQKTGFVEALNGAGDGNRTRTSSLEGYSSTIELLPPWQLTAEGLRPNQPPSHAFVKPRIRNEKQNFVGGGRWIRTTEGMSQQIYSLPPLAAWVSLRTEPPIVCSGGAGCQGGMERAKEQPPSTQVSCARTAYGCLIRVVCTLTMCHAPPSFT